MEKFVNKVWLSTPTKHEEELIYITEAFEKNWKSTVGENIDEIEKIACEKVGCKYAVALSCGTAALHLAVKLAGVKEGDYVFCSDMTFAATVNPVLYEKATPIFIDSEYDTWNMDPIALEKAFELYPNTKVIIVVNLYGTPAKLDEICAIAKKHGAIIIEDAAESLGATYKGKQTGTFGTYNAISFNGNKIITGSSGGMLLTDDLEAANKVRKWSTQSRENAPWYQHEEVGYNYRISNIIAGIVRGQFPYLEEHKVVSSFTNNEEERLKYNIFEDLVFGRTYNWAGTYLIRTAVFFQINNGKDIYLSRYGQNMQILLPMAYYGDCGFIAENLSQYKEYSVSVSHKADYENNIELLNGYKDIRINVLKGMQIFDKKLFERIEQFYALEKMNTAARFKRKKEVCRYFKKVKKSPKNILLFLSGVSTIFSKLYYETAKILKKNK